MLKAEMHGAPHRFEKENVDGPTATRPSLPCGRNVGGRPSGPDGSGDVRVPETRWRYVSATARRNWHDESISLDLHPATLEVAENRSHSETL